MRELEKKQNSYKYIYVPAAFVVIIWVIFGIESLFYINLTQYSVFPGRLSSLSGALFFPLLHGDINHIMSNTIPLLLLGAGLIYFYPKSSTMVLVFSYIIPGVMIWLFARPVYHIGSSGIVYSLAAFIFFSGVIRRDKRAIVLALLVTFIYGGMVWGVLPLERGISWEGHLFGALTGIFLSALFRKKDKFKEYDWEEEESAPQEKPEISYSKGYPFDEDKL